MSILMNNTLDELHPKVKDLALKLLAECQKQGLNIAITETYRSKARQDYLYSQGRTRSGQIVTYSRGTSMSSYHQWRLAFDIYNNVPGDAYNADVLKKAGAIGEKLGLEWGGSWKDFKDMPHFQYTFGLSIMDLKTGKKPPDFDLNYELGIEKLTSRGVISTPKIWIDLITVNPIYTQRLIINIAQALNSKIVLYQDAIKELTTKKIIGSPELWQDTKKITVNNVRSLIKKAAEAL